MAELDYVISSKGEDLNIFIISGDMLRIISVPKLEDNSTFIMKKEETYYVFNAGKRYGLKWHTSAFMSMNQTNVEISELKDFIQAADITIVEKVILLNFININSVKDNN